MEDEFEMTALEALNRVRRAKLVNRDEYRQMVQWLQKPVDAPRPPHLKRASELVFLVQTRPPTPSRH